ncbi:hypothetical protein JMA_27280 [Jeotgalibacillus malaysiensis]|uniref:Uncharacterized protein n=1 Tax=Jeotgalibacillus malaysiensis TaxID=1508404 RepID=A0A0B5AP47_9BACL|nr:hypothetical protein [Jeotgalibacillus malaysiensis]AJD92045.1 hypothetical protein JMA_27280 [Jeotgalibacillus malaysiensis]
MTNILHEMLDTAFIKPFQTAFKVKRSSDLMCEMGEQPLDYVIPDHNIPAEAFKEGWDRQREKFGTDYVTYSKYKEQGNLLSSYVSKNKELQAENDRLNTLLLETDRTLQNERYKANKKAEELMMINHQLKHAKGLLKSLL